MSPKQGSSEMNRLIGVTAGLLIVISAAAAIAKLEKS